MRRSKRVPNSQVLESRKVLSNVAPSGIDATSCNTELHSVDTPVIHDAQPSDATASLTYMPLPPALHFTDEQNVLLLRDLVRPGEYIYDRERQSHHAMDASGQVYIGETGLDFIGGGAHTKVFRFDWNALAEDNFLSGGAEAYSSSAGEIVPLTSVSVSADGSRGAIVSVVFKQNEVVLRYRQFDETLLFVSSTMEFAIESAEGLSVGVDNSGRFVIVWSNFEHVYAQWFDASGLPLGSTVQVNSIDVLVDDATVAVNADGDAVITWVAGESLSDYVDFGQNIIYARLFDADGVPQTDSLAISQSGIGQGWPSVDITKTGDFVIVWHGHQQFGVLVGQTTSVFARRFTRNGVALGPQVVVDYGTSDAEASYPSIALDEDGGFVVVWTSRLGSRGRRFESDGRPVGGEIDLSSIGGADVLTDGNGLYTVIGAGDIGGVSAQRLTREAVLPITYTGDDTLIGATQWTTRQAGEAHLWWDSTELPLETRDLYPTVAAPGVIASLTTFTSTAGPIDSLDSNEVVSAPYAEYVVWINTGGDYALDVRMTSLDAASDALWFTVRDGSLRDWNGAPVDRVGDDLLIRASVPNVLSWENAGVWRLEAGMRHIRLSMADSGTVVESLRIEGVVGAGPMDINKDGSVDALDASLVFAAWATNDSSADFNSDGIVDAADAGLLFEAWTGDNSRRLGLALVLSGWYY